MAEYGDNEPIPEPSNNELTGSYPNMKTKKQIESELGLKEHERPYWGEKK
jgi:hypothetical protein